LERSLLEQEWHWGWGKIDGDRMKKDEQEAKEMSTINGWNLFFERLFVEQIIDGKIEKALEKVDEWIIPCQASLDSYSIGNSCSILHKKDL